MKLKLYLFIIFIAFPGWLTALNAQAIKGVILQKDTAGKEFSLPGANVYHISGNPATSTDAAGKFSLHIHELPAKIVVSFVGYQNDTLEITEAKDLKIVLRKTITLKDVNVEGKQKTLGFSTIKPINIETITGRELLKAACCNLSESFETNPTVNVS